MQTAAIRSAAPSRRADQVAREWLESYAFFSAGAVLRMFDDRELARACIEAMWPLGGSERPAAETLSEAFAKLRHEHRSLTVSGTDLKSLGSVTEVEFHRDDSIVISQRTPAGELYHRYVHLSGEEARELLLALQQAHGTQNQMG